MEINKEELKELVYKEIKLKTIEKMELIKTINYLHKLLEKYPNDESIKENLLILYNYIE